jgi:hypothetical protein
MSVAERPPTDAEIAVDPELAVLHALRVSLRMTATLLQATLPELGAASTDPALSSILVARCTVSRALDLARWIDAYQRARRRENAAITTPLL